MMKRALRQAVAIALLALLPSLVSGFVQLRTVAEAPLKPHEIRAATARQWGAKVQWVDARPAERFEAGHIQGAFRFTVEEWETLMPKFVDVWDGDKTVVIYCDGGECDASHALANRMRDELQIQGVFVLQGGWPAWQAR